MANRRTRGRQRIPMRLIEDQDDLYASFSKRRQGLYKKASELSTHCDADIGIIMFTPKDVPHSFFHPSMESVVDQYRNPNQPVSDHARIVDTHTRARIQHLNRQIDEMQDRKEEIEEREKQLDEVAKTHPEGWWEIPVENLTRQQVKEQLAWFQEFKAQVRSRIEAIKGTSSSAENQPQNVQNLPHPPPGFDPGMYFQAGSSSSTLTGGMQGGNYQFPSQYTDFPPQSQHPFAGGDPSYAPSPFNLPPGSSSEVPDPLFGVGTNYTSDPYYHPLGPSSVANDAYVGGGSTNHPLGPYYPLPEPSSVASDAYVGGGSTSDPLGSYYPLPGPSSQAPNPTTGTSADFALDQYTNYTGSRSGSGSGQAGPSH